MKTLLRVMLAFALALTTATLTPGLSGRAEAQEYRIRAGDRLTIDEHFHMQVWPGRAPGTADKADHITGLHPAARDQAGERRRPGPGEAGRQGPGPRRGSARQHQLESA